MEDKKYTTFIDNAGRAVFTEVDNETSEEIVAKNPVMITVQQSEQGQMAVQLFPLFFQEFVEPGDNESRANYFTYRKNNIALGSGFTIESRIVDQYEKIVNPMLVPNNPTGDNEEPEVIKLFDE
jgi:hypothetical protein|tara:strand:- start:229 stop:600 length:372 start_codon:yes stop_codon:yes gene_type:complete